MSPISKWFSLFFFFIMIYKATTLRVHCPPVMVANLWNDGQFASQISKSKFSDINAVNFNPTPWLC